ncbi:selenoneine biosynthesis selenosugar synthase SenB [Ramlibacter sp. AN1133]|uniref:selenoneine biosynthesis selenosugar synthase SenB n=1 Tax=Ramlibacter sp. AN1133 TaxID=3133429 RepID=UPI0030C3AFFE
MSRSSSVVIVSPALADANNGNWRTARRWQELLAGTHPVRITKAWPDAEAASDDLMLALHARRSAGPIAAWAQAHPGQGLAVILTGTDLYQDILADAAARHSLELAQRLVVLQECGPEALPAWLRGKTRVIYQSSPALPPLPKDGGELTAVAVGHLRQVKSPQTLFAVARLLCRRGDIRIRHIGDATAEPVLGDEARAAQRDCPNYEWLGGLPHAQALEEIRRAHVLVHPSALEGGAHVILEAVRCGTPVLASRVPGNVGMLGRDYEGYFPHGDAGMLAQLLQACRAGQQAENPAAHLLGRLAAQCALRAPLFDAAAERSALLNLLEELESVP